MGLDVGTGANFIYPLLGAALCGWRMVGADVTDEACTWASRNAAANPHLSHLLEVRRAAPPAGVSHASVRSSASAPRCPREALPSHVTDVIDLHSREGQGQGDARTKARHGAVLRVRSGTDNRCCSCAWATVIKPAIHCMRHRAHRGMSPATSAAFLCACSGCQAECFCPSSAPTTVSPSACATRPSSGLRLRHEGDPRCG